MVFHVGLLKVASELSVQADFEDFLSLLLDDFLETGASLHVVLNQAVKRGQPAIDVFDCIAMQIARVLLIQDLLVQTDGLIGLFVHCVRLCQKEHCLLDLRVDHVVEELLL